MTKSLLLHKSRSVNSNAVSAMVASLLLLFPTLAASWSFHWDVGDVGAYYQALYNDGDSGQMSYACITTAAGGTREMLNWRFHNVVHQNGEYVDLYYIIDDEETTRHIEVMANVAGGDQIYSTPVMNEDAIPLVAEMLRESDRTAEIRVAGGRSMEIEFDGSHDKVLRAARTCEWSLEAQ